jgi:hypothetical protein
MQVRAPVHGAGLRGGMKRFLPPVSAPYGMPRKILMPVFAMPRTTPVDVSTSKNSGPFMRAVERAGDVVEAPRGAGCCASASADGMAADATAATPALIT